MVARFEAEVGGGDVACGGGGGGRRGMRLGGGLGRGGVELRSEEMERVRLGARSSSPGGGR